MEDTTSFWLTDHLLQPELLQEEDYIMDVENAVRPIQVLDPHPIYDFSVHDFVAVPGSKTDPFWLAVITSIEDDVLSLTYYDHNKPANDNAMVWRKHHTTGSTENINVLT